MDIPSNRTGTTASDSNHSELPSATSSGNNSSNERDEEQGAVETMVTDAEAVTETQDDSGKANSGCALAIMSMGLRGARSNVSPMKARNTPEPKAQKVDNATDLRGQGLMRATSDAKLGLGVDKRYRSNSIAGEYADTRIGQLQRGMSDARIGMQIGATNSNDETNMRAQLARGISEATLKVYNSGENVRKGLGREGSGSHLSSASRHSSTDDMKKYLLNSLSNHTISEHTRPMSNVDATIANAQKEMKDKLPPVFDLEDSFVSPLGKNLLRERVLENARHIDQINKEKLSSVLSDVGSQAQGVVALEVWVYDPTRMQLVRTEHGWWREENYEPVVYTGTRENAFEALARLEDEKRDDYIEATPMQPGQGFVGNLWSTKKEKSKATISAFGSFHGGQVSISDSFRSAGVSLRSMFQGARKSRRDHQQNEGLNFVDLDYLARDPDTITDLRIQTLLRAGIEQACSATFNIRGHKGLVIYFASAGYPISKLLDERNKDFLIAATDSIGATLALAEPRRTMYYQNLHENHESNFQHRDDAMSVLSDEDSILTKHTLRKGEKDNQSANGQPGFFGGLYRKSFGKKQANPPKAMPFSESLWTLVGCSITLVTMACISQSISFWNERADNYSFPVGPFGALATLQYGLTAAPASQPRNCIYGTVIAGSVGLAFSYLTFLPHFARIGLGASFAISGMTKAGVTHPPGGALAVLYASGGYHFGHLLLSLTGNVLAISFSMLVNNANEKRQYPQYWSWKPW